MDLIEEFIEQYKKEYDFYNELARLTGKICENEIMRRGIKAIVSFRAKRIDRLEQKIRNRNQEKKYSTIKEIGDDIFDLAGVRVSLYFPSDRIVIDDLINESFHVVSKKEFPDGKHKPHYKKRFSGYWAAHYRVKLRPEKIDERYINTIVEIQVASVLMLAWAEIEHDLVYKPLQGEISEEELAILDEINGLVLSGEIAMERLQKAIASRTSQQKQLRGNYELTTFIVNYLKNDYKQYSRVGDINSLDFLLKRLKLNNPSRLVKYIKSISDESKESISDQIIDMILLDNISSNDDYFNLINDVIKNYNDFSSTNGFELFIKTWIILEKAFVAIVKERNLQKQKKWSYNFDFLTSIFEFSQEDMSNFYYFKKIRNELIHGIETPSDYNLRKYAKDLKPLVRKLIGLIQNTEERERLTNELEKIHGKKILAS